MRGLAAAFMLLTRLPVGRFAGAGAPDLAGCVWAFPIVGLTVGGAGAAAYWAASRLGMTPLLAGAWTLAVMMAATGALHEDGLADTADGFGGGASSARKLEIMRDSRIGTYGASALLLSSLMRIGAMAALQRPALVATALILAGMLGRSAMILLLLALEPARAEGMGAAVGKPPAGATATGFALAAFAALAALRWGPAIAAISAALGCALAVAFLARRQIGGYTGDVLGAAALATECVVLTALAAMLGQR